MCFSAPRWAFSFESVSPFQNLWALWIYNNTAAFSETSVFFGTPRFYTVFNKYSAPVSIRRFTVDVGVKPSAGWWGR